MPDAPAPPCTDTPAPPSTTTHFGYETVALHDKQRRVAQVFDSVAQKYDLMNDLMSFGLHRWWKHVTLQLAAIRPGDQVLDLAGGTGDLAIQMARRVGPSGRVILADINASMLSIGRDRLLNQGIANNVSVVQANAQCLPFADNCLHWVTMAFGLRNVTDKQVALASMHRVLKPGGQLLVLEFSKPQWRWLSRLYDLYSFAVLPRLGQWVAHDSNSYQYLAQSIRMHPDQQRLQQMMQQAGLVNCQYHNLSGGIVALHTGVKP